MFKQRMSGFARLAFIATSLATSVMLTACGGSGDDDSSSASTTNYAGTYAISATKTLDSCNSGADATFTDTTVVSQSGSSISLSADDESFKGQVSNDGEQFQATYSTTQDGVPVTSTILVKKTSTANTYTFTLTVSATAGSKTCTVTYQGTAAKQS